MARKRISRLQKPRDSKLQKLLKVMNDPKRSFEQRFEAAKEALPMAHSMPAPVDPSVIQQLASEGLHPRRIAAILGVHIEVVHAALRG